MNEGVVYTEGGIGVRTIDKRDQPGSTKENKCKTTKKQNKACSSLESMGLNVGGQESNYSVSQQKQDFQSVNYQQKSNQNKTITTNFKYEPLIS